MDCVKSSEKSLQQRLAGFYIHIKYISINETYNKAARNVKSTLAVFQLTTVLKDAVIEREEPPKGNNKNQKIFEKMLIMRYKNIKLIVGVQRTNSHKVQYCLTHSEITEKKRTDEKRSA